jgi:riboflavin biosynthesis pyrimidine reductase
VFCPKRFVFDRHLKTASLASPPGLFTDQYKANTTVLCLESANDGMKQQLRDAGIGVWELPEEQGHLSWEAFRARCVQEEIFGVYIEVGPSLATALIEGAKVDYLFVYQAPKFMADAGAKGIGSDRRTIDMGQAIALCEVRHEQFGEDWLTRGRIGK